MSLKQVTAENHYKSPKTTTNHQQTTTHDQTNCSRCLIIYFFCKFETRRSLTDAYKHRRLPLLCNVIYTYIPYATHDILIRLSLRCASLDLGHLVKHWLSDPEQRGNGSKKEHWRCTGSYPKHHGGLRIATVQNGEPGAERSST